MFEVTLADEARDFFEAAATDLQRRLDRCFDMLKETPRRHPNVKPLKGRYAGQFRYRVGDYRVVYLVDDAARLVHVVRIAHRRDVYE